MDTEDKSSSTDSNNADGSNGSVTGSDADDDDGSEAAMEVSPSETPRDKGKQLEHASKRLHYIWSYAKSEARASTVLLEELVECTWYLFQSGARHNGMFATRAIPASEQLATSPRSEKP
ncbi:hypothetical protein BJ742DRAFT_774500 [Cladochytrium replicatum]|nr:hypothetical protein BJ742DRAFT_774500 [Cladochytrium replicatum]